MSEKKLPPKKALVMPMYMNFIIGGVSGMLAICIVQPADLLKTRMQLVKPGEKDSSLLAVTKNIINKEGVLGFYTGLSAAVLRQATYTTARLGAFNGMLDMYTKAYGPPPFPLKVGMGVTAGACGAWIGTPADVALIRMTADGMLPKDKRRNYTNVFNALARITREEGIKTCWTGATATITRAMVVNGAQLGSYAQAREMLMPYFGDGLQLHSAAAMISGFVTTVASLPMDIVKTRVQNAEKGKRVGQIQVLVNVVKKEGFLALWSGMLPTYAKLGPITIFTVQNADKGNRMGQIEILSDVVKREGFLALWAGMLPTYAKLGPVTIITFLIMEQLGLWYYRASGQMD